MTDLSNVVSSNYKDTFIKIALGVFIMAMPFGGWYFVTQVNFGKITQAEVESTQVDLTDTTLVPDSLSTTSSQVNEIITAVGTTNSINIGSLSVAPNSLATSTDQGVAEVTPLESDINLFVDVLPDSIATSS